MRLHSRSIHTFVAAGLVTSLFVCYAFGGDCLFPTSCICCNGSFPPGVCKDCGGPTQCCPYVFDVNQAYPCVESAQGREGVDRGSVSVGPLFLRMHVPPREVRWHVVRQSDLHWYVLLRRVDATYNQTKLRVKR
jgi:hypothetical protein